MLLNTNASFCDLLNDTTLCTVISIVSATLNKSLMELSNY